MRVVHVSEVSAGGVRRVLSDFAADQVARGFDVHVVGDPSLAAVAGTHHQWRGSRRRPATALTDLVRLHRLLAELSPDVIHLHSFFAGFFGRLPGSMNHRAPVVYQPHSWAFDAARARPTREAIVRFERWAASHTDLVTTNCHDEIPRPGHTGWRLRPSPWACRSAGLVRAGRSRRAQGAAQPAGDR